jgi:thioredoxin reductase
MTAPMELSGYGTVKLFNTSKDELLGLWNDALSKNEISIRENTKVEHIIPLQNDQFKVVTTKGEEFIAHNVLIAIGRRGSPRKLNVPGEGMQKVAYRLLEPELISGKDILVVGGGDSAIESALLLMDQNKVTLSYRKDKFSRLKPKNREKILDAINENLLSVQFNSNVVSINEEGVLLKIDDNEDVLQISNDLVYIYAGGELPTNFLKNAGIEITKRFGYIMKQYNA